MSKICPICKGRGRWMETHTDTAGFTEMVHQFCNTCQGTGVSQDPEDGQDWDIGGDSYVND